MRVYSTEPGRGPAEPRRSGAGLRAAVLQLADHELACRDRRHGKGEASWRTVEVQRRVPSNPGLRWGALNVKKHVGAE